MIVTGPELPPFPPAAVAVPAPPDPALLPIVTVPAVDGMRGVADRAVASTMPTSAPRRPTAIHPITAGQPANISHHAACI